MTTKTATPAVIYPDTDGKPLPDNLEQEPFFIETLATLKAFFTDPDILVSGNTIIYYEEGNPNRSVAPDCYIVFGVRRESLILPDTKTYLVWEAGKFPDFVLEIASSSTARNDTGPKRDLYARLGALEYWRYDPTGGDLYGEPLVGEYLVDGEYRRFNLTLDPDGTTRAHSPLLNLDLRSEGDRLRFYDPVSDRWLENFIESQERANAEQERANAEQERANAEQERADAAEARVAELEAELRRLRTR